MPKPRPPYLQRHITRHGKAIWVVQLGRGPKIRLRAAYGTPEFDADYTAAVAGKPLDGARNKPRSGSLAWLWDRYRETGAWKSLSNATRRQRENIMKHVLAAAGTEPYTSINKASIVAGRDKRSSTPAQARNFLDAMRGLFHWAKEATHVRADPTDGVTNPKRPKGRGFPAWTESDVETYCRRWPIGTRQRVWLDVVLYTGLRRGDLVVVGRQHERDGVVTLRTEKGGETVTVTLPILAPLRRTLDVGPIGQMAWICGERGAPLTKESFGNMFSEAARQAGIKKSAHGVRKIAATTAANNGASEAELDAIFGWSGKGRTSAIYTREANRARLAKTAMAKLDGERTSVLLPDNEVRASAQK